MDYHDLDEYATLPILYYDVLSSHARSCQMLVNILKIDVDLQSTDSMEDVNFGETYTWINSFCKLPTLVDGNVTLCNGHSILIYLCQKYALKNFPSLCPCDYITRQKITSLLYYEGFILNRYLNHLMTDILLAKFPNFDVDYHKNKISNAYNSLNTFLKSHSFMIGSHLTIADISIISTVSALNIIVPISHGKFPKLFEWFHRLKKMDFYKCNDEGIHKLRYILENVGKFPFPSTLSDETENIELDFMGKNAKSKQTEYQTTTNHNANGSLNKSGYQKPIKNNIENGSKAEQHEHMGCSKEIPASSGYGNDEADTFNFYDTYFINVSKCNCCGLIGPKQELSRNAAEPQDVKQTSEIFKRSEALESQDYVSSSGDENVKEAESHNPLRSPTNVVNTCCCSREFCNGKERLMPKNCFKKTKRINQKIQKSLKNNQHEKYWQSVEIKRSSSDDTDEGNTETNQQTKNKSNQTYSSNANKSKEPDQEDKDNIQDKEETEIVPTDERTSKNGRESAEITEKERRNSWTTDGHCGLTNQEFQDLLAKVRKYEQILEKSDEVLRQRTSIPSKTLSDTSSMDAMARGGSKSNMPFKCDIPKCSCHQKQQQCDCHKKHKRRSSRIEALEFDEVTPMVLPTFLVTSLDDEPENCVPTPNTEVEALGTVDSNRMIFPTFLIKNSKNETKDSKIGERLEAGTNLKPFKGQFSSKDLQQQGENSDDNDSQGSDQIAKIIYLCCIKSFCTNKNKCRCEDCCKKGKSISSKIPRLISHGSLVNGRLYKSSHFIAKDTACSFPNKQLSKS